MLSTCFEKCLYPYSNKNLVWQKSEYHMTNFGNLEIKSREDYRTDIEILPWIKHFLCFRYAFPGSITVVLLPSSWNISPVKMKAERSRRKQTTKCYSSSGTSSFSTWLAWLKLDAADYNDYYKEGEQNKCHRPHDGLFSLQLLQVENFLFVLKTNKFLRFTSRQSSSSESERSHEKVQAYEVRESRRELCIAHLFDEKYAVLSAYEVLEKWLYPL